MNILLGTPDSTDRRQRESKPGSAINLRFLRFFVQRLAAKIIKKIQFYTRSTAAILFYKKSAGEYPEPTPKNALSDENKGKLRSFAPTIDTLPVKIHDASMSSHHVVREQQEPALLLLGPADWNIAELPQLLEWVPTILVTEENVQEVSSTGIKVDVVLADPNFAKQHPNLAEEQFPLRFLPAKKTHYLPVALDFLIRSGHAAVNILPFDPLHCSQLEPYFAQLDLVFFNSGVRYFPAKDGRLKKWLPACTLQVLGEEGQLIEHRSPEGSEIFPIRYLTSLELTEGLHAFSSNRPFWLGAAASDSG